MKAKFFLPIILISAVFATSCDKESKKVKDIELTAKQKQIVESGNEFSLNLLREYASEDGNFMISPLSVNYALAMTANGARNNTLTQMLAVLDFAGYEMSDFNSYFKFIMEELQELDPLVQLSIANSIWYHNQFNVLQDFLDVNIEYYNAEVQALDFANPESVNIINNWVADKTNDKITKIITSIPASAVMYLINAVYFYGEWKYEFDPDDTEQRSFYLSDNNTVEVDMMKLETKLKYYIDEEVSIVELPYGRGNYVMDILIPAYGSTPGELINQLDSEYWNQLTDAMTEDSVLFSMPKWKFEYETLLNTPLQNMGMTDLFVDGVSDLSGINSDGGLYVSRVIHKTYIEVDEAGTEAAAVTAVEIATTSVIPDGPISIIANRPFVFIIRESDTNIILFEGVVKNP
jgi:serine protease inhibitor